MSKHVRPFGVDGPTDPIRDRVRRHPAYMGNKGRTYKPKRDPVAFENGFDRWNEPVLLPVKERIGESPPPTPPRRPSRKKYLPEPPVPEPPPTGVRHLNYIPEPDIALGKHHYRSDELPRAKHIDSIMPRRKRVPGRHVNFPQRDRVRPRMPDRFAARKTSEQVARLLSGTQEAVVAADGARVDLSLREYGGPFHHVHRSAVRPSSTEWPPEWMFDAEADPYGSAALRSQRQRTQSHTEGDSVSQAAQRQHAEQQVVSIPESRRMAYSRPSSSRASSSAGVSGGGVAAMGPRGRLFSAPLYLDNVNHFLSNTAPLLTPRAASAIGAQPLPVAVTVAKAEHRSASVTGSQSSQQPQRQPQWQPAYGMDDFISVDSSEDEMAYQQRAVGIERASSQQGLRTSTDAMTEDMQTDTQFTGTRAQSALSSPLSPRRQSSFNVTFGASAQQDFDAAHAPAMLTTRRFASLQQQQPQQQPQERQQPQRQATAVDSTASEAQTARAAATQPQRPHAQPPPPPQLNHRWAPHVRTPQPTTRSASVTGGVRAPSPRQSVPSTAAFMETAAVAQAPDLTSSMRVTKMSLADRSATAEPPGPTVSAAAAAAVERPSSARPPSVPRLHLSAVLSASGRPSPRAQQQPLPSPATASLLSSLSIGSTQPPPQPTGRSLSVGDSVYSRSASPHLVTSARAPLTPHAPVMVASDAAVPVHFVAGSLHLGAGGDGASRAAPALPPRPPSVRSSARTPRAAQFRLPPGASSARSQRSESSRAQPQQQQQPGQSHSFDAQMTPRFVEAGATGSSDCDYRMRWT